MTLTLPAPAGLLTRTSRTAAVAPTGTPARPVTRTVVGLVAATVPEKSDAGGHRRVGGPAAAVRPGDDERDRRRPCREHHLDPTAGDRHGGRAGDRAAADVVLQGRTFGAADRHDRDDAGCRGGGDLHDERRGGRRRRDPGGV
ncbi:hypothetical protein [Curtobacterium sp. MCPF17_052]|uniref:hypothetical protein n=1 Tax=Curtobacterium sp. MCPF17_052 TaxID=2175655 RepID=UPI0024DF9AFF|nr:hypothetical protein [Curtobacterium sp. MCPF17_052]WIB13512.1 hypothetical protein DEJ36_07025 [Curtobacterium sp. MCPF17_052]